MILRVVENEKSGGGGRACETQRMKGFKRYQTPHDENFRKAIQNSQVENFCMTDFSLLWILLITGNNYSY